MQIEGVRPPDVTSEVLGSSSSVNIRHILREVLLLICVLSAGLMVLALGFDNATQLVDQYWVVFFLAILAAAVANATAVGGGFVFMPLFSFGYGFTAIESLKLALATQAFGMTSGAMSWSLQRIQFSILSFSLVFAVSGVIIGSYWILPDTRYIHVTFGTVSLLIAILILIELWLSGRFSTDSDRVGYKGAHVVLDRVVFSALCFTGGLITAWVSIGIGEVVAVWMLLRLRYSLVASVATGVAALAVCSVVGFLIHMDLGGIRWEILAFTAPGVLLGGRYGGKLGLLLARDKHNAADENNNSLRYLIVAVIVIDGLAVLTKSLIQG